MFYRPFNRIPLDNSIPFMGMLLVGCLPSPLKRIYYRMRGATIGKRVSLGIFSYIESPVIRLGDDVHIGAFSFIRARTACIMEARSSVGVLSAVDTGHFELGEDSTIGEQVIVGGMVTPRSSLIIGKRSKIIYQSILNTTEAISIGNETSLGTGVAIFTHGTWQSMLDGFPGKFGSVTIGDGAWIGSRTFILPHVTVGKNVIIGANSVVSYNIAEGIFAAGVPARPIKQAYEHVILVDELQKHLMVMQWLKEFADYLCYNQVVATFNSFENEAEVMVHQSTEQIIFYRRDAQSHYKGPISILLSLAPISIAEREIHSAWFDIAARECKLNDERLCDAFRQFLARYGLRFDVVDHA